MSSHNPQAVRPGVEQESQQPGVAVQKQTGSESTTLKRTITTGHIVGETAEAFQIVAGSDFPVDGDPLVRFAAGDDEQIVDFAVDVDESSLDTFRVTFQNSYVPHDVYVSPPSEQLEPQPDGEWGSKRFVERATFYTPYDRSYADEMSDVFTSLPKKGSARYLKGGEDEDCPARWNVRSNHVTEVMASLIDEVDHQIVIRLQSLRQLVDPHPEYTIQESGEFIITENAQLDPDYYESEEHHPAKGHGKGGNPHDVRHHLQDGNCPAYKCDAEFDTFRELRSHIGGKCGWNNPDSRRHEAINLRLQDLSILNG